MKSWRRPSSTTLFVGLVPLLAVGSLSFGPFGLQPQGLRNLPGLPAGPRLDYSAVPFRGFAALREAFVAKALGESTSPPRDPYGYSTAHGYSTAQRGAAPGESPRVIIEHKLTNDRFSQALRAPSVPFTAKTNTAAATRERGEPGTCGSSGGTVWYRYTPTAAIGLAANTFGSDHHTALAVYTGTRLDELRRLGCDDDNEGDAHVAFAAKKDVPYYFRVTAPQGSGNLVFSIELQGRMTMASITSSGRQSSSLDYGTDSSISGDGRFVAFTSYGEMDDSSGAYSCQANPWRTEDSSFCVKWTFVRDRTTHKTWRVSESSDGEPADAYTDYPNLSYDGRYIAFSSYADNLVPGDRNGDYDVFVVDRITRRIERASAPPEGADETTGSWWNPWLFCHPETPDAFPSQRPSLGSLPAGLSSFICSLEADQAELDSAPAARRALVPNVACWNPQLSFDGRYVAFECESHNTYMVPGDTNGTWDVFVHDRLTGKNERVSVSSSGKQGNRARSSFGEQGSYLQSISADGRYVSFRSSASNLVPNDTNGFADVFVHDRVTRTTRRVSVSSTGQQANGESMRSRKQTNGLSADGRYVAFLSQATNLVENDRNGGADVFVRDLVLGRTERVSVSSLGREQANKTTSGDDRDGTVCGQVFYCGGPRSNAYEYSMSADGRFVVFTSDADNLMPGDRNGVRDVFLHDRHTKTTSRISVSKSGAQSNGPSYDPVISADGVFITFVSDASNLVENDTNEHTDAFVYERPLPGKPFSRWH